MLSRRQLLGGWALAPLVASAQTPLPRRRFAATGQTLGVIGLGTWQRFDIRTGDARVSALTETVRTLLDGGAQVIDSSPMYGLAEATAGHILGTIENRERAFLASKIWAEGRSAGERQLKTSAQLLGAPVLDLMFVHNLRALKHHWRTLKRAQQNHSVRAIGASHYHVSALAVMGQFLDNERPDAIQINYSLAEPDALNLIQRAAQRDCAVIVNRPFAEGALIRAAANRPLPGWLKERSVSDWPQAFLKWILAEPAVTIVLTGTGNPQHLKSNLDAARGWLPDPRERLKLERDWRAG
jgi:diketogulonate reductase-like aldo/keto reductase